MKLAKAERVLWLEQALEADPGRDCPPIAGRRHVDVCIVGGGYTGLWTALELCSRAPHLDVLVLEAMACGFGASGRNGGWVVGWHDKLSELIDRFGVRAGLWLADRAARAVTEVGDRSRELGIECHFRRAGALYVSSAPAQDGRWSASVAACARHERDDRFRPLEPDEAKRRTGIQLLGEGAEQTDTATVHPGLLVRGLRRAALERGVQIAEGSPLLALRRGDPPRLETPLGTVVADQAVLALGAWSARVRELRRAILPFSSHMVASAPASAQLTAMGWHDGPAVSDLADLVHYGQRTYDGRIAFGRGGGAIGAFGRVDRRHFEDERWTGIVASDFRRWFPALADVPLTHRWGGPIDHSPGYFPFAGSLGENGNVHYAAGYSGDGVAQSTFMASILASRVLGTEDDDTRCPLATGPREYLPPEPLRSLGGWAVREATLAAEAAEAAGRRPRPASAGLRRLRHFSMPRLVAQRHRP